MKNIIRSVSLAALVATASVSAANAEAFKGFYIGGQAGWQGNHVKSNFNIQSKNGRNTFLWGAHMGMSTVASNGIYMAGELTADFNTGHQNTSLTPGMFAKLGYRFTPQFVFAAKAGMVYNRYRLEAGPYHVTKSRFGFAPGVEALYAVKENHVVGLSYTYTYNSSMHFGLAKMKTSTNSITAKYAYKF